MTDGSENPAVRALVYQDRARYFHKRMASWMDGGFVEMARFYQSKSQAASTQAMECLFEHLEVTHGGH